MDKNLGTRDPNTPYAMQKVPSKTASMPNEEKGVFKKERKQSSNFNQSFLLIGLLGPLNQGL